MAPFVALTETAGGLLLIIGLATPLVGVALAVDMLDIDTVHARRTPMDPVSATLRL